MPNKEPQVVFEAILSAQSCDQPSCPCKKAADKDRRLTHCPAHEDITPSLSVRASGSKLLVRCHAGCSQESVITALKERNLWAVSERTPGRTRKSLGDPHVLSRFVLKDGSVAEHWRQDFTQEDQRDKSVWWTRNGQKGLNGYRIENLPLYGAENLAAITPGVSVVVAEGERARDALVEKGVLGVGRSFLYDLVRRGVVKSVKLGRARRIPVAELEAYAKRLLEEQEGEGR